MKMAEGENVKRFLGILGGMGPAAGGYLFHKILAHTPASTDQGHLEILLYSNPRVPDRTQGILGFGPSAEPELVRSVQFLERAGAECIVIACVTAHCYMAKLRAAVKIPILSIIEETADHIDKEFPAKKRVGILATTGTLKSGLFQQELEKRCLETIQLPDDFQESLVMGAIYGTGGIKAGHLGPPVREKLLRACNLLVERGAEVLVAGCTEIPLALQKTTQKVPLIDTMDVLARRTVRFCLGLGR